MEEHNDDDNDGPNLSSHIMMTLRINFMIQLRMLSLKLMTYLLTISSKPCWRIKWRVVILNKLKLNACDIEKVKPEPAEFVDEVFLEDKKESVTSLKFGSSNAFMSSLSFSSTNSTGSVLTFSTSQTLT